MQEVIEDIAGNTNGTAVTAAQLNSIASVSGAVSGTDYSAALAAANPSGFGDINNPTAAEIQAVIDVVNAEITAVATAVNSAGNNTLSQAELTAAGVTNTGLTANEIAAIQAAVAAASPAPVTTADLQAIVTAALASITNNWIATTPGNWTNAANWANGVPTATSDVTLPGTAQVTVSGAIEVNSLTIESGGSLIAKDGITGTVNYKRNLSSNRWFLVASPVTGETIQDIMSNHTLSTGTGTSNGKLSIAPYNNNNNGDADGNTSGSACLLYTSPSPRD